MHYADGGDRLEVALVSLNGVRKAELRFGAVQPRHGLEPWLWRLVSTPRPLSRVLTLCRSEGATGEQQGSYRIVAHIVAAISSGFAYVGADVVAGSTRPAFHASMPIPNCATARLMGRAPAYRGQSGCRSYFDRDGDGIACELYRG
jgi:hypothetical protein